MEDEKGSVAAVIFNVLGTEAREAQRLASVANCWFLIGLTVPKLEAN